MPKPVMATAQDVKDADARLSGEIARVQSLIEPAVSQCENRLRPLFQSVDQKVDASSAKAGQDIELARTDAKNYTNDSCKALHSQILPLFPPIEASILQQSATLTAKIETVNQALLEIMKNELSDLASKFDTEIAGLRSELNANMQKWATEAAEALVDQRKQIDQAMKELQAKLEKDDLANKEAGAKAVEDSATAQAAKDQLQDERNERAQSEIYVKIEAERAKLKENVDTVEREAKEAQSSANVAFSDFVDKSEKHFDVLDDDCRCLRNAISEVENVPTRKVDWVIKNVSKRIRPLSPSRSMLHTSWFSPKFDAAGAHGLQLELQLFRGADPPVDGEDAGDVAIHLWACKGMSISYKLSCGMKTSPTIEKVFNGRVPYGTKRMCFLKDQVNRDDDTLRISVEILEAIREVEHIVKPPPPPIEDPEAPPKTLEEIHMEKQVQEKALEGSIYFQRSINNRLYDQVKNQVDLMQSRMVRKIEWRVECASLLRRCFPPNECLCSVAFSAAGIEGMQFVFYPSGYNGCSEGFTSLFLYGPAGATLKCWLSAGNQKREASHTFDEPGAFGRTNFCRFESCVDESDDSVLIMLEIEDASQDWTAHIKHPALVPGDKRGINQLDGSSDKPFNSVVKLTKKPGQKASGKDSNLIELKVLPSLWTAKQLGTTVSAAIDGTHTFDDLRERAGKGAGRQRSAGNSVGMSTMQNSSMVQASSSMPTMPTMRDASLRTAIEEDLRSPLPQLSKTFSGSGDRDFTSVRKAGAQRGKKQLGATMTAM